MIKNVVFVQPKSAGGNFEYVAIPRQGMLFLSAALKQYVEQAKERADRLGSWVYDTRIWFEDKVGQLDIINDLQGVDVLCVTGLINEIPRAYEIASSAKKALSQHPHHRRRPAHGYAAGRSD
jgi:hypothetical protein